MLIKLKQNINLKLLSLNWKLLIAIFSTLFIPLIYQVIRMHFIGSMPNSWSYSIAANMQWINIFFEVMDEAIILPLFYVFSRIKKKDVDKEVKNRQMLGIIYIIGLIYLIFIIIVFAFSSPLFKWISPKTYNAENLLFVRLELISKLFIFITKIGIILLIINNDWKKVFMLLLLQMTMNILLDIFVISNLKISIKMGVKGIGMNNIISNFILSIIYIYWFFKKNKISLIKPLVPRIKIKTISQFFISGLESFIRNAFFIFFVIKTINKMEDGSLQGVWWTTSTFIWTWMLIPIFSISQYINREKSLNPTDYKNKIHGSFILVTIIVMLWFIFIPVYKPFIKNVLKHKEYDLIFRLILISIGFYILFAYNEVIDKSFYGDGKASYLLFQSLFTNVVVYLPFYFLNESMTIYMVAIMFGVAIAVDSTLTILMYLYMPKISKSLKNYKMKKN